MSSVNSMTVFIFSDLFSEMFFFPYVLLSTEALLISLLFLMKILKKNVVGKYREYNSDCFYDHILQALQTKYVV